jgi:hypothetical protein
MKQILYAKWKYPTPPIYGRILKIRLLNVMGFKRYKVMLEGGQIINFEEWEIDILTESEYLMERL